MLVLSSFFCHTKKTVVSRVDCWRWWRMESEFGPMPILNFLCCCETVFGVGKRQVWPITVVGWNCPNRFPASSSASPRSLPSLWWDKWVVMFIRNAKLVMLSSMWLFCHCCARPVLLQKCSLWRAKDPPISCFRDFFLSILIHALSFPVVNSCPCWSWIVPWRSCSGQTGDAWR